MTDHLSDQNINLYISGSLSPTEFLSMDDHLSDCISCRDRLAVLKGIDQKLSYVHSQLQSEETNHLPYEMLETYVDEKCDATDREIVQSHLQFCADCQDLVDEFNSLKTTSAKKESVFGKVLFLWRSPEYGTAFRSVSIAAVMAFFALIAALLIRGPETRLAAQLEEANKRNLQSQEELKVAKKQLTALHQQIAELKNDHTAPVIASIQDHSRTVALNQQGDLIGVNSFPEHYQQMAKLVLQEQRVPIPGWLTQLQQQNEKLMGQSDGLAFQIISPVGIVVESPRPDFHWQSLSGASEYRVKIYDTNFHLIDSSRSLHETSWTPANNLPRGSTYIWNVTAIKNGKEILSPIPPAAEARFKVLEENKYQELKQFRENGSHLLTGLAYMDSGLIAEARAEFQELLRENPDSAPVKKLVKSLPR